MEEQLKPGLYRPWQIERTKGGTFWCLVEELTVRWDGESYVYEDGDCHIAHESWDYFGPLEATRPPVQDRGGEESWVINPGHPDFDMEAFLTANVLRHLNSEEKNRLAKTISNTPPQMGEDWDDKCAEAMYLIEAAEGYIGSWDYDTTEKWLNDLHTIVRALSRSDTNGEGVGQADLIRARIDELEHIKKRFLPGHNGLQLVVNSKLSGYRSQLASLQSKQGEG